MTIRCKYLWLYAVSVLLLCTNFYGHILSTLPLERFMDNEFPSERFMISRMIHNDIYEPADHGGFMLRYDRVETLHMAVDSQPFRDIISHIREAAAPDEIYRSHLGVQDNLMEPVWHMLRSVRNSALTRKDPGSRWHERMTHDDAYYMLQASQFIVSLINALILSLFILWAGREFGPMTGFLGLVFIVVLLPDLTYFGRSMWWMTGSWLLPFLIPLFALQLNGGKPLARPALVVTASLAGLALSLKTAMGYEFTSTIMTAAAIPFAYYGLARGWSLRTWLSQSAVLGMFQLAGLGLTLYLHAAALETLGLTPISFLQQQFEMRAHGGDIIGAPGGAIQRSFEASPFTVIVRHLFLPQGMGIPQIALLLPLIFALFKWRGKVPAAHRPMMAAIGLGFFVAISMFVILKGHAYIHGFDVVAFSLPMNLFLCVLYARWAMLRIKETAQLA